MNWTALPSLIDFAVKGQGSASKTLTREGTTSSIKNSSKLGSRVYILVRSKRLQPIICCHSCIDTVSVLSLEQ